MDAVILAGGLGTRLRPFTEVLPKPLLPLGDKSILEHQLVSLKKAGVTDVYIATNYLSHLIEAFLGDGSRLGLKVHISKESSPLGTAGPIKLLENNLKSHFLVMNGDIVTKLDFKKFYEFGSNAASVLTVGTKVITTPFRFGNVTTQNGFITGVEEKPDFKLEIVAGMYCMDKRIMNFIPANTYFGIDQLIKALLSEGEQISRFLIEDYWLDIGQVEDYSKAREIFKQAGA